MRYNGQLHRTPRYSRVPARDDHGAPRCVGRDGRMRPTVQRVLGASDAAAARPARSHASSATRVAPSVRHSRRRRSILRKKGVRHTRAECDARRSVRTACASQAVHSSDEGRAAHASRHAPERRPPTATSVPCRAVPRGICNIRGCRQPETPFFCYYFSSRSKIVIFILEFSLQKLVIS